MHVCHLGCDLWIVGNCLKTILLDTELWGSDCDDDERLMNGWLEFKQWARTTKWQSFGCKWYAWSCVHSTKPFGLPKTTCDMFSHYMPMPIPARHSMGKFATKTITSRQHGYPELQSKAWNVTRPQKLSETACFKKINSEARVAVAWMGSFMENLCRDEQFQHLNKMRDCVCLGFMWIFKKKLEEDLSASNSLCVGWLDVKVCHMFADLWDLCRVLVDECQRIYLLKPLGPNGSHETTRWKLSLCWKCPAHLEWEQDSSDFWVATMDLIQAAPMSSLPSASCPLLGCKVEQVPPCVNPVQCRWFCWGLVYLALAVLLPQSSGLLSGRLWGSCLMEPPVSSAPFSACHWVLLVLEVHCISFRFHSLRPLKTCLR